MLPFFSMIALAVGMLPGVWLALRFHRRTGSTVNPLIYLAALVPGIVFFLFLHVSHDDGKWLLLLLLAAGSVGFIALWVRELVHLMGLSDEAFPGRHDKLLWFALLVCLPPIGTAAFAVFRRAYWSAPKTSLDTVARDLA